ncbi:hypothetical protein GQ457_16G001250 [Hibiscus cannabinus]
MDHNFLQNNEQRHLRKVVSDVSWEIEKYTYMALESSSSFSTISTIVENEDEVTQAECECCGLKEDCTPDYITRVRVGHGGKWVCGLCSEAVKERLSSAAPMADAVSSHREFCQKFNSTTRLNPKLSLTCAMRDIAKRSHDSRGASKIARSISCVPKLDLNKHSLV